MNKSYEKEYKILVTKQQFEFLYSLYPCLVSIKQVNTYYDTKHLDIRICRGAMRIREKNGSFLFTLKMPSEKGLLEYECPVDANNASMLHREDIKTLLYSYGIHGPFQKLTSITTYRAIYDTTFAQLCFDKSIYHGITDYEIEYEYKKDHDGHKCFQELLDPIGLLYKENCTSKMERALHTL